MRQGAGSFAARRKRLIVVFKTVRLRTESQFKTQRDEENEHSGNHEVVNMSRQSEVLRQAKQPVVENSGPASSSKNQIVSNRATSRGEKVTIRSDSKF